MRGRPEPVVRQVGDKTYRGVGALGVEGVNGYQRRRQTEAEIRRPRSFEPVEPRLLTWDEVHEEKFKKLQEPNPVFFSPRQRHELMRWRVRLFCGHMVERMAHASYATYGEVGGASSLKSCEECGLTPATILASEPIGLLGDFPGSLLAHRRAELHEKAAKLERQLAKVREELEAADRA